MITFTWKAVEWLEKEYDKDDIVIGFFMKGSYLPKDKALAEKEFKFCVQALKDREDENVKKWVCNIIASDFGCVESTYTVGYWSSLIASISNKEDIINTNELKIQLCTPSSFNKRHISSDVTPPTKHITITDNDGIMLDGLSVSLFSHLKTIAVNKLYLFKDYSEKEQYYTTMTKYYSDKKKLVLNGIIQLDNILLGYKGDTKDVKIPLFQALGFSADIYYLYRVNPFVYILNHVGSLNYPVSKKDTANKTTDLIGMLLKLKNMIKALEENISDFIQSKKKRQLNQ